MKSNDPRFSIPSVLAIVCAIASFNAGAAAGFMLAIVAMVLGILGLLIAFRPQKRGGIVSIVAVLAGAAGILAAIFKGIAYLNNNS